MIDTIIVDDERDICEGLCRCIDWHNFDYSVIGYAENGYSALEQIKKCKPGLVLTDIRLPGISGIDLCKEIRILGLETNVIIISGYDDFEYAQKAMQYHVDRYLLKPVDKIELISALIEIRNMSVSASSSRRNKIEQSIDGGDYKNINNGKDNYENQNSSLAIVEKDQNEMSNDECRFDGECGIDCIRSIKQYINKYYYNDISVKMLSNLVHMDAAYLGKKFSHSTGYSLNRYINKIRIQNAINMLINTDLAINEISYRCGYHYLDHFYRNFNLITGENPGSFKRKSIYNNIHST